MVYIQHFEYFSTVEISTYVTNYSAEFSSGFCDIFERSWGQIDDSKALWWQVGIFVYTFLTMVPFLACHF